MAKWMINSCMSSIRTRPLPESLEQSKEGMNSFRNDPSHYLITRSLFNTNSRFVHQIWILDMCYDHMIDNDTKSYL